VSQRNIDELLAKRSATPVFDPVTGESSFTYLLEVTDGTTTCTQTREVHYVDAEGARQRVDLARTERLGGVSLWALGFDSPATWQSLGPLARIPGATTTSVAAP
jgi:spore germination protein YaaH